AFAHRVQARLADGCGQGEEELVLRLEVRVEGAPGEAGALADGLDGRALQAHLCEDLGGGLEQARTGVLPAPRRRCRHRSSCPPLCHRPAVPASAVHILCTASGAAGVLRYIYVLNTPVYRTAAEAACPLFCPHWGAGRSATPGACSSAGFSCSASPA